MILYFDVVLLINLMMNYDTVFCRTGFKPEKSI